MPPLDKAFAQATAASQASLDPGHAAVVLLMVVAEEVQETVEREDAHFAAQRMPGRLRLTARDAGGDHHVSEVKRLSGRE